MGSSYAHTTSIGRLLGEAGSSSPLPPPPYDAMSSGGRARSLSMSSSSSARSNARRCGFPECMKTAKPGGLCISHGGGKKCSVEGCTTSVVSRGFCVAHGGGKRCQRESCTKSAQTGGFCWIHGGGKKCGHDGCTKRAQSGGACISHGGGKRCRIDGCNKVVQYECLCVGHGGYRKCLSMNCVKKALPNGYCQGHGGNAKCHFGECAKKAVHGGYCGQHRGFGSPQQVARSRSSSADDSPVVGRTGLLHEVATISPLMPVSSTAPHTGRDWSQAIAEAKSGGLARIMGDQSVRRLTDAHDAVLRGGHATPTSTPCRLPTVLELQRTCSLDRSVSPLKIPAKTGGSMDRIAPLLSAVESAQARASPHTIKRESALDEAPLSHQCTVRTCGRFAKVDGLCLLHHHLHHDRPTGSPAPAFPSQYAPRTVHDVEFRQ